MSDAPPPGGPLQHPLPPGPSDDVGSYAPAPATRANGCLKALLITLAVLVVLALISAVALIFAADRFVRDSYGEARTDDFTVNQADLHCAVSPAGLMSATGTITNTSDHTLGFRVSIQFTEGVGGPKVADTSTLTGPIPPGQPMTFTATMPYSAQLKAIGCTMTGVSYFGP